jgi:nitrogenase-associated protein
VAQLAIVLFYEKPGCGTHARQKRMLEVAGHTVIAVSLLEERWTEGRLLSFFGDTPVASWFNPAAPRVKSGEIDPARIDAVTALSLLVADRLLIRRPFVEACGQRCAGFDREPVTSLLAGLQGHEAIEGCSRPDAATHCPGPPPLEKPS